MLRKLRIAGIRKSRNRITIIRAPEIDLMQWIGWDEQCGF